MNDLRPFGALLREARQTAGLTQEDLSAQSGLSARSISDLERGQTRRPYFRSVKLLADALDLPEPVRAELHAAARGGPHLTTQGHLTDAPAEPLTGNVTATLQQLPASVADFTGRERETGRLLQALSSGRRETAVQGIVICGPPGVGKTTLAVRVAHLLRPSFPDGQLWVHLEGASGRPRDPGDVLGELLRALGITGSAVPSGEAERAALYRSRLAGRRMLLVADDASSSTQVRPLIPGAAGGAVLVTSRVQLTALPGAGLLVLDPFTPDEAMNLLVQIIGEERISADRKAAEVLADACGLMPLAVRIAGARLAARPSWPVALLAQKMAGQRRRLDELQSEDQSVRVSVSLSYDALGAQAQRAFRLLGLLGAQDIAEWVIAALLDQPDVGAVVNELVEKSLLTSTGVDDTGQARYRLHDLLHEYARDRLTEEPPAEQDVALRRALESWLYLAWRADRRVECDPFFPAASSVLGNPVLPNDLAGQLVAHPFAWFAAERLNLLEAVDRAGTKQWLDLAADLAICQGSFQYLQDRSSESAHMWRGVMNVADRIGDRSRLALAEVRHGAALVVGGHAADAAYSIDHAVQFLEGAMDQPAVAFALYWRASVAYDLDRFDAALEDGKRGVALARRAGNRHAELLNLRIVGESLAYMGHTVDGLAACERALSLAEELGGESYEVAARHALAYTHVLAGDFGRARILCLKLVDSNRRSGMVRGEGLALGLLGDACHGLGRYEEAARALQEALPIFRDHSNRRHHALCLLKLGYAYKCLSLDQRAAGYLWESLRLFGELRLPQYERRAHDALSELFCTPQNGHRN